MTNGARRDIATLEPFFLPRSIAIVGLSRAVLEGPNSVFNTLKTFGFDRVVHIVNPKISGSAVPNACASVADLPGTTDLSIVVVGRNLVLQALQNCIGRRIKAAIVITRVCECRSRGRADSRSDCPADTRERDSRAETKQDRTDQRIFEFHVMIGVEKEPVFGHCIVFGVGGIYTKVLPDSSFRLTPLSMVDAYGTTDAHSCAPILKCVRGEPRCDIDVIAVVLLSVSVLIGNHPEISEMDVNLIMVTEDEANVVDVRIIL